MQKHAKRLFILILALSLSIMSVGISVYAEEQDSGIMPLSGTLPGSIFDDVAEDAWYTPYIGYVLNKGIMTGKGDNQFAPGETICRAQFATILYRMSGSQPIEYSPRFPDVPTDNFYTFPVLWAAQENVKIIEGYENGNFGPNDAITREQLATMLFRYANYLNLDTTTAADLGSYPDASSVTDFAKDAMSWAVGVGIITGDNGRLDPQGDSARAVCATMIQRFCENLLPEELPDVEMNAFCENILLTPNEPEDGTFWVKLTGISATYGVQKVSVAIWCDEDQNDIGYYSADYQPDGSYGFSANIQNHRFHFGTYHAAAYVLMNNGVRLYAGSGSGQISETHAVSMHQTAQNYASGTDYLLVVDTTACRTGVFFRNGNTWDYMYYWLCAPGAPSTPTVTGVFTITPLKMDGFYSFGSYQYYATQFYGNYLFHSTTYNMDGSVQDDRVGMPLSHGCVRLETDHAKWIYDNIPVGTTVVIY